MFRKYIMAIDQGTTGTTVLIIDHVGSVVSRAYREFSQIYPQPGWVEHDPEEIWETTYQVARQALQLGGLRAQNINGIGITNQRETTIVWEKSTGRPITNAIVWQCRRTAPICEQMKAANMDDAIRSKTGLVIDAYFSATKLAWILDSMPQARQMAENGDLLFGTVDSYLVWKMTGGQIHITDYSNASRTMLYNINTLEWDQELLDYFAIPRNMLPQVVSSSAVYGETFSGLFDSPVLVAGVAGDQQAALFGQTCFQPGCAKNTYGTGCFLLMNTGGQLIASPHGLLTTIGWGIDNRIDYALEGSIFIAGAAIQWLRDEMKIISSAAESEILAISIPDNGGVYLVPAFVGLGAPHWDMYARGTVVGLTRGAGRAHLTRAALESLAYQTYDILEVMARDADIKLESLKVDGGVAANNFLMQFQADMLGVAVERPQVTETTAMGAAFLAGLATGYWKDLDELKAIRQVDKSFVPRMAEEPRRKLLEGWQRAMFCARSFPVED